MVLLLDEYLGFGAATSLAGCEASLQKVGHRTVLDYCRHGSSNCHNGIGVRPNFQDRFVGVPSIFSGQHYFLGLYIVYLE